MFPLPIRLDAVSLPALIVGALLLLAAAAMGLWQWWTHRQLVLNSKLDEVGYRHSERQIRFRLAVSGLLFLLGVAIPLGDQLDVFFRGRPAFFFTYWIGVLFLIFAMVVVAIADAVSTLAFARLSQVELRHKRNELAEEIRKYRASKNGSAAEPEAGIGTATEDQTDQKSTTENLPPAPSA